jgi:2-oxoglutarate dehydrogenase E2 component (dihydrolipoamide succinyltransferase)
VPAAGVPFKSDPLPRAKRIEAKYLSSGFRNTLASVVTVACPTRGLRAAASAHSGGAGTNATAVILFEAARLLRKYPAFNAFFAEGNVNAYEQVHIGFALDGGHGLKVPVIRDADAKSIQQITAEMQDLVVGYLDEKLPVESLAGGTFTVTDLSGEGVFSFHPLINQGQSAILGLGAEFFPPGTSVGMFNLILAFDHQLAEGRMAAKFLGDLRERLGSYESALAPVGHSAAADEPACSQCLTPLSELRRNDHHLLQAVTASGAVAPVCSACVSGWR